MIYCFDIDGTICSDEKGEYWKVKPYKRRIKTVNRLYDEGHTINLYTSRGKLEKKDWLVLTKKQLKKWKLKYHSLVFGKEYYDYLIDNRAINDKDFFK